MDSYGRDLVQTNGIPGIVRLSKRPSLNSKTQDGDKSPIHPSRNLTMCYAPILQMTWLLVVGCACGVLKGLAFPQRASNQSTTGETTNTAQSAKHSQAVPPQSTPSLTGSNGNRLTPQVTQASPDDPLVFTTANTFSTTEWRVILTRGAELKNHWQPSFLSHTYVAPTAKQLQERIFKIVQQARPRAIQEARAIRLQCSHWSHALRRLWRGRVKAIYSLFKDLYNIKKSPLDHELAEIVVRDYIQDLCGMNERAAKLQTVSGKYPFVLPEGSTGKLQVWHASSEQDDIISTTVTPMMKCWFPTENGEPGEGTWKPIYFKWVNGKFVPEKAKGTALLTEHLKKTTQCKKAATVCTALPTRHPSHRARHQMLPCPANQAPVQEWPHGNRPTLRRRGEPFLISLVTQSTSSVQIHLGAAHLHPKAPIRPTLLLPALDS